MKKIFYSSFLIGLLAFLFAGCKKDEVKAILHAPVNTSISLSAADSTFALDSTKKDSIATKFEWDKVEYNQDLAVTYILQFANKDSSFENATGVPAGDVAFYNMSVGELNRMAILAGLTPDIQGEVKVRAEAVVEGLNSAPQLIEPVYSNVLHFKITPYVPDTKYPVPAHLYIVGTATDNGWTNPVPVPEQEFTKSNFYTYNIKIHLNGGGEYLLIPVNGSWAKYSVPDNSLPEVKTGTDFEPEADDNMKGPDKTGWYIITVNFLSGKYEVTPTAAPDGQEPGGDTGGDEDTIPEDLYIVGDATVGGWDRPVTYPDQQHFDKVDDHTFETTLYLFAGKSYLLTPKNVTGNINEKYGVADNTATGASAGGDLDAESSAQNIPAPDNDGWYKISVDFESGKYTVTSATAPTVPGAMPDALYIVGDATSDGWTLPVSSNQEFAKINDHTFEINVHLTAGKEYLLTPDNAAGNINNKYAVADNTVPEAKTGTAFTVNSGQNIPAPDTDGWYKITVDFATGTYAVSAGYDPVGAPNELYIVGDATQGGWGTPVPDPEQKFTKTDDHTFQTIVYLNGGKQYLLMPQNVAGNIPHKYGIADANDPNAKTGTGFIKDNDANNIPAPDNDGWYKITVDFQAKTYTVESYNSLTDPAAIPENLYILGDAVGSWDNPVADINKQTLARVNAYLFTITTQLEGAKPYKFILQNGSWDTSIGVDDTNTADKIHGIFSIGNNPANIPAPDQTGVYKIVLNFLDYTYTLTKQ